MSYKTVGNFIFVVVDIETSMSFSILNLCKIFAFFEIIMRDLLFCFMGADGAWICENLGKWCFGGVLD